jgi:hypothetical protein
MNHFVGDFLPAERDIAAPVASEAGEKSDQKEQNRGNE